MSVLYVDVVGFTRMAETLDPEVLTRVVNALFDRFGEVVDRYDGTVDKLIGDAMMVLFGAPETHEDDALRAVRTALDMHAAIPRARRQAERIAGHPVDLAVHIGIATGTVLAGWVGAADYGTYTVMGDAVNLGARLVDIAGPGETLICETTRRLARSAQVELAQTVRVKGKAEPVAVYRLRGGEPEQQARGVPGLQSALIGRRDEVDALVRALSGSLERRGTVVGIRGPAGIGKSRLVREALGRLPDRSAVGLQVGRCVPHGRAVPMWPWRDVVAAVLAELDEAPSDVLEQVMTGAFVVREGAKAEDERERLFTAVIDVVLRAATIRPQVILLEDLHWGDATSVALLEHAAAACGDAPVALVAVHRGSDAGESVRAVLGRRAGAVTIELRPLSPRHTVRLVEELTRDIDGFDKAACRALAARSGGVPLFVEELLRHYMHAGTLRQDPGGSWRFVGEAPEAVPPTLHGLVAARVDRLPKQLRRRLQIASVFGTAFEPEAVDALLGKGADREAWERLEAQGEVVDAGGGRARFALAVTRDVVYARMLRTERQRLHRVIGDHLAARPDAEARWAHPCGWHYEQAGLPERAAPFWLAAARQAAAVFANVEALTLLDRVRQLVPASAVEVEAVMAGARVVEEQGRVDDAGRRYELAVELATGVGDDVVACDALVRRAWTAYHAGDGDGIVTWAERALARAKSAGEGVCERAAWRVLGVGHEFAGRFDDAIAAYERLLAAEAALGVDTHTAGVQNSLGEIARARGAYAAAIRHYDAFAALDDPASTTYLGNKGAALVQMGAFDAGIGLLTDAIERKTLRGHSAFLAELLTYRGLGYLRAGRLVEAVEDGEAAWRSATDNGEREMLGLSLRLVALLVEARPPVLPGGVPLDADGALAASATLLAETGKRGEEAVSRWLRADLLVRRGRPELAGPERDTAAALFADVGVDPEAVVRAWALPDPAISA